MNELDVADQSEELQRRLVDEYRNANDPIVAGAALLLAGLEVLAAPFRLPASPGERKLIRSHYPPATDETIDAHRLDRKGLMFIMDFIVTAGRKYLDHQPETAAVFDRMQSPDNLEHLVEVIARNVSNSFAGGVSLDASGYDISAAIITNTVAQALDAGVAPEQLMTILYEGVQRVIEYGPDDRG